MSLQLQLQTFIISKNASSPIKVPSSEPLGGYSAERFLLEQTPGFGKRKEITFTAESPQTPFTGTAYLANSISLRLLMQYTTVTEFDNTTRDALYEKQIEQLKNQIVQLEEAKPHQEHSAQAAQHNWEATKTEANLQLWEEQLASLFKLLSEITSLHGDIEGLERERLQFIYERLEQLTDRAAEQTLGLACRVYTQGGRRIYTPISKGKVVRISQYTIQSKVEGLHNYSCEARYYVEVDETLQLFTSLDINAGDTVKTEIILIQAEAQRTTPEPPPKETRASSWIGAVEIAIPQTELNYKIVKGVNG